MEKRQENQKACNNPNNAEGLGRLAHLLKVNREGRL